MEQIMVKTEVQSNGEILLYYVDENGENQEGVLTTIENIEDDSVQIQDQDTSYMLESYGDLVDDPPPLETHMEELPDPWSDDETKRLLIFFNDNKASFVSGVTKTKHLWAVACKTMLIGKNHQSCEEKLSELKSKYCEVRGYINKGVLVKWPLLDLCHQAFHDDASVIATLTDIPAEIEIEATPEPKVKMNEITKQDITKGRDGVLSIKQMNTKSTDEQVEQMLNMYLKYKDIFRKEHWRRDLWDKIAEEMGEEDSEYLQKRFLNYKQHYINMLLKKKELGSSSVNWPYMGIFDKIYSDDASFHKKYFNTVPESQVDHSIPGHVWTETQKTILLKYYFDCYDEFQDPTIPNRFLWTEVGRLIDKKPETCKIRYEMLNKEHLENYIAGDYNTQQRKPIAIILDNIILKDVKKVLSRMAEYESKDLWKPAQKDELVQFFYDNTEIFKDQDCHFVCWAAVAHKLKRSVESCKQQWDGLVSLYSSILEGKKEDPDMEIGWRYIEMFDRIFDYGMDTHLLQGYNTYIPVVPILIPNQIGQVAVKKVNIKTDKDDQREHKKEKPTTKAKLPKPEENIIEPRTDPRSSKVLEHYLRNKDKFSHSRNKLALWEPLAKQFEMTATQCAHRFKSLKETYMEYIQKEIDKPRISITWPYYVLCKKVFGYRALKHKLKVRQTGPGSDNWLAREIKMLLSFFAKHYDDIANNVEDFWKWEPLAKQLGKTETDCKDKFLELRKCYRKLKTMRARNPDVKISWSYFNMFERIYSRDGEVMLVESLDDENLVVEGVAEEEREDDFECIIVLEDGQDIQEIQNVQEIQNDQEIQHVQVMPETLDDSEFIHQLPDIQHDELEKTNYDVSKSSKWTRRDKKRLLINYINYIRSHKGEEIQPKQMWTEIAAKLPNKTIVNCRKMFAKMKNSYKHADDSVKKSSPFSYLLEIVIKLKPLFRKTDKKRQNKTYKDYPMSSEKVKLALQYYLDYIEEFVNPRFEKKYLWTQLAEHISEPVTKVYNKINYLKQAYNILTEDIAGEKTEFSALLKEIIAKEVAVKMVLDVNPNPDFNDDENSWTDDETEQLMSWYLGNLDKFKNPKFNRTYLWLEASNILSKSPLVCSKKMSEIRTQYRNMVRDNDNGLGNWRFFELCQKIYGTGKKSNGA